jgi:Rad3-related DNA helicase
MSAAAQPVVTVPVRELVGFVCRTGDLAGDGAWAGPQRALAGTLGHQRVQRARPADYQKEVRLSLDVAGDAFILRIQGRLDGWWTDATGVRLEEIKTVGRGWDGRPDPLHWAQAKCYGYMFAGERQLAGVRLQLTYLNLATQKVTEFDEVYTFSELAGFFTRTTEVYQRWLEEQFAWRQTRDRSIGALAFPFARYRPGQRALAVAAYRALARGGRLFLEAPTGIGKTISVLFPAVKALGEGTLERIFYLTATTTGRLVAEAAAADLRRAGLRLRTLTLTARSKVCRQDGQPCELRTCPLARGYYDRRHAALRDALAREELTRPVLEAVGREHQVCPFELALDLSEWVEVVIGDYNYVFDPKVYLRRHFAEPGGAYGLLVDEAHNLVDRARAMFSADLEAGEVRTVARLIRRSLPRCARALGRLATALERLAEPEGTPAERDEPPAAEAEGDLFAETPASSVVSSLSVPPLREGEGRPARRSFSVGGGEVALLKRRIDYKPRPSQASPLVRRDFPAELTPLLENALDTAADWLARNEPAEFREPLLELSFRLNSFLRTAGLYDERYVTLLQPGPSARVKLFCLDPSHLLAQALARGRAAVCFSATLTPMDYYRRMLGGAEGDPVLQLPSPFPPENLGVFVQDRIRTDWKARADSLGEVVRAIGAFISGRPGNYLVYLPSYQYLTSVVARFQTEYPTTPILVQRPGLDETEREAFLSAFATMPTANSPQTHLATGVRPSPGAATSACQPRLVSNPNHLLANPSAPLPGPSLVGFAVLGGIFGEGIDLVGDRLIGAVVVGVGLPQLEVERDLIADYFQAATGAGFDYAYTFPGLNRVLQAVGRVIRSDTDRGAVLLIDARFGEARYRRLLPAWWRPVTVGRPENLPAKVRTFWAGKSPGTGPVSCGVR